MRGNHLICSVRGRVVRVAHAARRGDRMPDSDRVLSRNGLQPQRHPGVCSEVLSQRSPHERHVHVAARHCLHDGGGPCRERICVQPVAAYIPRETVRSQSGGRRRVRGVLGGHHADSQGAQARIVERQISQRSACPGDEYVVWPGARRRRIGRKP